MYLWRIIAVFVVALYVGMPLRAQETIKLTPEEVKEYTAQCEQMVMFLEGSLNFLGDGTNVASEKDIIINESYNKIFIDEDVQIEDDLDPERETPISKDVQAYLKDVDFFYKNVRFIFEVTSIEQFIAENGSIVFKVTMTRNLRGTSINNVEVDNNQIRYVEINLDPFQKELKIASIYTTKLNQKEELRYWWENMAYSWKTYFSDSTLVYDTLLFEKILSFTDTALVVDRWLEDIRVDTLIAYEGDTISVYSVPDSVKYLGDMVYDSTIHYMKVYDTIPVDVNSIFKKLIQFTKIKSVDIANDKSITSLNPLIELTDLQEVNFSNTLINDITPLRNLNKLETIRCANSRVTSFEQLRYASNIKFIDCSNTKIGDIEVLANLVNLEKLNLKNTMVNNLAALSGLQSLIYLNLSGIAIADFTAIDSLKTLSDLNISNTQVTSLSVIARLDGLQTLNIDSTAVSDIAPLIDLKKLSTLHAINSKINSIEPLVGAESLRFIYCDQTGINSSKANQFMESNKNCLVVYNTSKLKQWWNDLPAAYKKIVQEKLTVSNPITTEQLHLIINQTSVNLSGNTEIENLDPLKMLHRLEVLNIANTNIDNIEPLNGLTNLREINISNTQVSSLDPLSESRQLKTVKCTNTAVGNLMPLVNNSGISTIYCDSSQVVQANVLKFKTSLPECLIVYQSTTLKAWWNSLAGNWQNILKSQMKFDNGMNNENLQRLVDLNKVVITDQSQISNLAPLSVFMLCETLIVSNTGVSDIGPILNLPNLENLNLSNNPIVTVPGISSLMSLKDLNLENTNIEDLEDIGQLSQLISLSIAGSKVKKLKGIDGLINLQILVINNTTLKSLKGVDDLLNLKELTCYRTSISSKNIEKFKAEMPQVKVEYY